MADRPPVGQAAMRVYFAMAELEEAHDGWPIPIEEITRRAGLVSKHSTHEHLQTLVRAGAVEKSPFAKGGYRVKRKKG